MAPIIEIRTHARMGRWTQFFEVPSESNPDKAYIVSADTDFKNLGCSCPAWTHHMPRVNCKHIARLLRERKATRFVTSDQATLRTPAEKLAKVLSRFAIVEID